MASHTQDDGFHEIQLNGKQLVFLFMAATVVSVVIFLCGVLVGRGVRAERGVALADASLGVPPPEPAAAAPAATPTPAGSDPTAASPPPAVDDLSYFNRLEKPNPPPEQLKPSAHPTSGTEKPAPAQTSAASPPPPPSAPAPNESAGDAWAVQIAALNARGDAEAIAKQLSSKGYSAYVVPPASGTSVYRVRIGTFKTRHEAEKVAAKLQKEEQFTPWITR